MNMRRILVYILGSTVHPVSQIAPPHHGKGVNRLYLDQYTKLNIWTLDSIGIKSLVYVDADTLVRRNFVELFTLPYNFAAVPDIYRDHRGFTVEFNAGVLFLRTSTAVFEDMLSKIGTARFPPSMAEQAFLNAYFGLQAIRLPYAYNANIAIKWRSPALWKAMVADLCIVHYTLDKPFPLQGQGRQSVKEFFESPLDPGRGLWTEEIAWWQESWRETAATLKNKAAHC
ncbi:nucleotide-diphospho-sugar transferase [Gautieria morchelliformis]|nr:nucleotide-diphospho-sugar transferase [Gautieria morchelliformis]